MELLNKSEFTLDLSTWRCGATSAKPDIAAGRGWTELLNTQGFMCCLGQFLAQLGVPNEGLYECSTPEDVEYLDPNPFTLLGRDSPLANTLTKINDSDKITILDKIQQIKTALENSGFSLVVVGKPTEPAPAQLRVQG